MQYSWLKISICLVSKFSNLSNIFNLKKPKPKSNLEKNKTKQNKTKKDP